jgi:hypothetical protein
MISLRGLNPHLSIPLRIGLSGQPHGTSNTQALRSSGPFRSKMLRAIVNLREYFGSLNKITVESTSQWSKLMAK